MSNILQPLAVAILLLSVSAHLQVITGQDFEKGVEAKKRGDYASALRELRPLAEQGHAGAQNVLGSMYQFGYGVVQNYPEAVKWRNKAALQGLGNAQFNLGILYFTGRGVTRDKVEGEKWLRKAAQQGHLYSQFQLGLIYADGLDNVRSYMWLDISAERGHKMSALFRQIVAKNMTPAGIAQAKEMARDWWAEFEVRKK